MYLMYNVFDVCGCVLCALRVKFSTIISCDEFIHKVEDLPSTMTKWSSVSSMYIFSFLHME